MTTATLSLQRLQKNLASIDMPAVNWKAICLIGFFASLALLMFYVWQVNDSTRVSYMISKYENQIGKLSSGNKNLEVSFAENSFLGQAIPKIQALNFQKVTSVRYVEVPDGSVVATTKK